MDEKAFVEKYRHEMFGRIASAYLVKREGPELSLSLRNDAAWVDSWLKQMHADLTGQNGVKSPPPAPPKRS